MHSKCISGFHRAEKDATDFDKLKEELDSIKSDIQKIKNMEVTEESKEPILKELEIQVNEVKERMHNAIDAM